MIYQKKFFKTYMVIIIFLFVTVSKAEVSPYVGVSVGDTFQYKFTNVDLVLKHNGVYYVNYQGNDIVEKIIEIHVNDIYESETGSFLGFISNKTTFNITESFDDVEFTSESYLDYWLDTYFLLEIMFNQTITNFNPEDYEFYAPDPSTEYNYTNIISIPIFASTNESMYQEIEENGLPEENIIYIAPDIRNPELKCTRETHVSYSDGLMNINVTNEDSVGGIMEEGHDWDLYLKTRYETEIDSNAGLVNEFMYSLQMIVTIDDNVTETITAISFVNMNSNQEIDFNFTTPLILITTIAIFMKIMQRRKNK